MRLADDDIAMQDVELVTNVIERSIESQLNASVQQEIRPSLLPCMSHHSYQCFS